MPSRDTTTHKHTSSQPSTDFYLLFFPIVILTLILWLIYRSLFTFPVWFDETLGKALFFGLPVWFFVVITNYRKVTDSFSAEKLFTGLMLGLAVGGIYGFTTSILSLLQTGSTVQAVWLFSSDQFWYEFGLALLTAFWETLLFYSFIMTVLMDAYPRWSLAKQVLVVAGIFVLFHIPNTVARFSIPEVAPQLMLLLMFAIGQALLFVEKRNAYALVLSHAIWGMVLLTHSW